MLKRYTFWLWTAVVFQLLTAAVHSVGLFLSPAPQTDTERQLIELMTKYRMDLGGFHQTMGNLMTALSSCFSFLYLLGGLTNVFLLRKKAGPDILKGSVGIHLIVFGACFAVMAFLTFPPPIIMTGLVFIFLVISYVLIPAGTEPEVVSLES
jgi:hypothetical protein